MHVAFRPAMDVDFPYCAALYFTGADRSGRDWPMRCADFRARWVREQVRIITYRGFDAGWLQTRLDGDTLLLVQFFVSAGLRNLGIGGAALAALIGETTQSGLTVTLGVAKSSAALRLYERFGFRVTHADARKFYMLRPPESASTGRALRRILAH